MATAKRDYYELLGVDRAATDADLKKAFRRLARELHPDVNKEPDAEARFKEVAEAYEVLSNAESRDAYDRFGHDGLRGRAAGATNFSDFGSLNDLFEAFFGGSDPFGRGGRQPGEDLLVAVDIEFVQSAFGVDREVELQVIEVCETCSGSGARPGGRVDTCSACSGEGQIRQVTRGPFGQFVRTRPCPRCHASGRIVVDKCEACGGNGRIVRTRTVTVPIPAGIATGQRIRMSGQGHAGELGAPPGDLYVQIEVRPDRRFLRDGLDVLHRVAVPVTDAMVGTTLTVPTVYGDSEVELRPGTQSGEEVVLRGQGFPAIQGRGKGDQRVVVEVRVPRVTTEEGRRAVTRLGETLTDKSYREDEGFFDRIKHAFR